jgi:Ca2+-binding RTX toxin-like protein
VNGTAATTAAHRIIYDKATGTLYYDRDGTGSAAQVRFALLTSATKPTLTAADFTVQ